VVIVQSLPQLPFAVVSRVIVVGSVNEDLLVRAPIPAPGETVAATGDPAELPGGKGANAASAAARLGTPTALVGCVGDDPSGARARAALAEAGVELGHLAVLDDAGTGRAIVIVDDAGENAIVIAAGANAALDAARVQDAVAALAVDGAVVLANLEVPAAAVAAAARAATAHGLRFVLDPAPPPAAGQLPGALLPAGAIVVPNEHELAALGGDPAALLAQGADAVIVTLGAAGAEVHTGGAAPIRVPAPVVDAVDTTGAGDAFRGTLAAALAGGDDLAAAVRLAVAAGAFATTAPGARGALGDRATIDGLAELGG
jgi:ribokinase